MTRPITLKCKYCGASGATYISMQPAVLTYISFIMVVIVVGLVPSIVLFGPVFIFTALKVHK